ncbi:hypothetical protein ABMA28_003118 [Loxostege sticticalis]|uniref:Zinc finger BED domain-containing protein 4 n=1 Tax=Loxostege sticticalis TaxID=481309 RepID=A0ABD0SV37_LOXSC
MLSGNHPVAALWSATRRPHRQLLYKRFQRCNPDEDSCQPVRDNAANMKAAKRLTNYEHLPCVAHTINLVVHSGLQDCGLGELTKKVKAIVKHCHKSPIATKKLIAMQEQLRPNQKSLKLIMDVVTRWNSTLDMIERIYLLQEPLEASLGILHNLSEGEWQTLPDIIKILKPFKQLTEEMSSEKTVTVSMILA